MTVATDQKIESRPTNAKTGHRYRPEAFPLLTTPSPKRLTPWKNGAIRWIAVGTIAVMGPWLLWYFQQPAQKVLALLSDQVAVSAYLQTYGAWGPMALALGQLLQVFVAFIPGHVLLIAAGYVYGFPLGFLLNLVCIVGASQLAFVLARWAGRPLVSRLLPADILQHWYHIGERQGFIFFTIAFLLPVFPTDAMNFVAGLSGISSRRFLAANILGRLPSAIMLTLIGSHGLQLSPFAWGAMAAVTATLFLTGRYFVSSLERPHSQLLASETTT